MIHITTNVDIIGLFNENTVAKIQNKEIEFFSINEFVEDEKIQDILLIFLPKHEKKNKIRKKGWRNEEAEYVKNYIEEGGNAIIIFPLEQEYLTKFTAFGQIFNFTTVLNKERKLLHINPNLLIFNRNKEGKLTEAKRFVPKYVHFLLNKKGEVIMEGNYLPVFIILKIGKGFLVLYGLGEDSFWEEDLKILFNYLTKNIENLFERIDYNLEFFKKILVNNPESDFLKREYIANLVKKRSITHILELKDKQFQLEILKLLDISKFEDFFQGLTGKKLEKAYLDFKNYLKNLKLDEVSDKLDLFFIKKISEKRISYNQLIDLFERGLLPSEAANLVVFFAEPVSPQDFRNLRESIKLISKWNEKIKLFTEEELKNLLWEKLQDENEKIKQWEQKQILKKEQEEHEKKKKEQEQGLLLKKLQQESLEQKKIEEKKKIDEEKERISIIELQKQLREERKRKYEAIHQKRIEREKKKEEKLIEARTRRFQVRKERDRTRRLKLIKRQKELEEEIKKLRAEKLKTEEEAKKREEEFQKLQEEWKLRTKKYKEIEKSKQLKMKADLEEKKKAVLEKVVDLNILESSIEEKEKIQDKKSKVIPISDELNEFIDFLFKPYEYFHELQEYNKLIEEEEKIQGKIEEIILEFVEFAFNPFEYLEALQEYGDLDDLD